MRKLRLVLSRKTIVASALLITVIAVYLFAASGGKAGFGSPIITVLYEPSVNKSYNQTFNPINQQMITLGIPTSNPDYDFSSCSKTNDTNLTNRNLKFECSHSFGSSKVIVNDVFESNWLAQSSKLEALLRSSGWDRDIATTTTELPIHQLFSAPEIAHEYNNITYKKTEGKVDCSLSIYWGNMSYTNDEGVFMPEQKEIRFSEDCSRSV